jgi:putative Ca2+/H+ antiporter (TMEM165/GDT1 family)
VSLRVIAVVFGVILVAELPDKTMIATVVLGSRQRPLAVWIGSSTALVVQAALAVVAGGFLALLPHRVVEVVVAALFAAGGVYLLVTKEEGAEEKGEEEAARAQGARRVALTTFGIIFVGEFGDLTQILTANLAAHYKDPWSVFVGAALGLMVAAGLAVTFGRGLSRYVPLSVIRRVAGVLLLGLAAYTAVSAARG